MKKKVGIIKRLFCLLLIFLLSITSFAAIVSDNDGSAFITKAEFDSLKNNFQAQIDSYNASIDSKIDGAIASYLGGIKLSTLDNINIWFKRHIANYNYLSGENATTNALRGIASLTLKEIGSGVLRNTYSYNGLDIRNDSGLNDPSKMTPVSNTFIKYLMQYTTSSVGPERYYNCLLVDKQKRLTKFAGVKVSMIDAAVNKRDGGFDPFVTNKAGLTTRFFFALTYL